MDGDWWLHLLWVIGAAGIGFASAALFAGVMRLRRPVFLIPYVVFSGLFVRLYIYWSETDVIELVEDNLLWGVIGAVVIGAFMVRNILTQPASARPRGAGLALDTFWSGLIYGSIDSLLLSVLPVLAVTNAFAEMGWDTEIGTQIVVGVIAFGASLFVTVAYHLGYPEFRNKKIALPALGMGMCTVGYLVTGNPVASVLSHVAMHVAAVLHGAEKTAQLPPHYGT